MKTVVLCTIISLLVACSAKENKPVTKTDKGYTLRLESKEYSAVKRYDDKILKYEIRAKSDSEAYEKGITSFASWQQAYDTVKNVYMWKSESFSVLDEEGNDVLNRMNESTRQVIQSKFKPPFSNLENGASEKTKSGSIALKNWRFGMPIKKFNEKEPGSQTVGKEFYFFRPLSHDSLGLYRIILEGAETNVKSFDTKVKKSVENLHNVFSSEYGQAKQLNPFPTIKNLSRGYIKWVYEWNAGKKISRLGLAPY